MSRTKTDKSPNTNVHIFLNLCMEVENWSQKLVEQSLYSWLRTRPEYSGRSGGGSTLRLGQCESQGYWPAIEREKGLSPTIKRTFSNNKKDFLQQGK